jgi:CHAT domain-containing protein
VATRIIAYPEVLRGYKVSLPGKAPQLYTTAVSQAEIAQTVEDIQSSLLEHRSNTPDFLPRYQQVYDWLIRPLETELINSKVKTIAFVLDGDLRNIPMSVLYDGKQYLVEKYAIALTPGLQLLDPKPLTQIELQALTAGLSQTRPNFEPHQGFDPLPNVPKELQDIAKVGLETRSLLNADFTQTALKQGINTSRSPVVHLATHAQFSSKAEDTFILAWDTRINIQQIDDLLRDDTLNQRTPIEILVLSACETASGDKRATLGLAGVAVKAGARSTLATLWSVVDDSTAKMMAQFYRQLEQSQTIQTNKAEALRQAQLTLIKDKKYHHPHFWSPFVLIGNWQ